MTKIERTLRDLSDLYEFCASLQEWKRTATIRDPRTGSVSTPADRGVEAAAPNPRGAPTSSS